MVVVLVKKCWKWFFGLFKQDDFLNYDDKVKLKDIERKSYIDEAERLAKDAGKYRAQKDFRYR